MIQEGIDSATIAKTVGVRAGSVRQIRRRLRGRPLRLEAKVKWLANQVEDHQRLIAAIWLHVPMFQDLIKAGIDTAAASDLKSDPAPEKIRSMLVSAAAEGAPTLIRAADPGESFGTDS